MRRESGSSTDQALATLHEAVTPEQVWSAACGLARTMGLFRHLLLGFPTLEIVPSFLRTTMDVSDDYFPRLSKVAPLTRIVTDRPGLLVARMSDFGAPHPDFKREFMDSAGWVHALAILFWDADGAFLGHFGVLRDGDQGDFSDSEVERWQTLQPQLNAAVRRLFALEKHSAARLSLERSLRSMPMPVALIGWDLSVMYSNHSGREALHLWLRGEEARLLQPDGEVAPDLLAACEALKSERQEAGRALPELARLIDHAALPGMAAKIHAIEPVQGRAMQPSFLIEFRVPEAENVEVTRAVASLSRLSRAEQEVARLAAAGNENSEIAARLGISHHTVRAHLRNIFEKLGIKSRSRLAPLYGALAILKLPAPE